MADSSDLTALDASATFASVLPPEGVVVSRLADIAARAAQSSRLDVAGVRGCADAVTIAALVRAGGPPVIVVAEDVDAARALAKDVTFLLGPGGAAARDANEDLDDLSDGDSVLVLTTSESSPYADVNPDRRAALSRMATLGHLAMGRPFRVLVVPATGLARKLVPRDVVRAHTRRVVANADLDRDALVRQLGESGYLRVPVVEDPGSFAVRGSLLDVWPPGYEEPARIELYGDAVLSIKSFDATLQTTRGDATLKELCPYHRSSKKRRGRRAGAGPCGPGGLHPYGRPRALHRFSHQGRPRPGEFRRWCRECRSLRSVCLRACFRGGVRDYRF